MVNLTGAFTNWVNGTTTANFGPGISVGGAAAGTFGPITVNSATSATASLSTSTATTGFRAVQIQTGAQTLTVNNGMLVGTCTTTAPTVIQISPGNGLSNVPLNEHVQIQFSVPMNPSTFSLGNTTGTTVFFYDATTGKAIPGTISLDASNTIATITPTVALPADRELVVYLSYASYAQDACGNNLPSQSYYFYTSSGINLAGPALTGTSPIDGDTNIPTNGSGSGGTPIVLQFSDQIDPVTAQTEFRWRLAAIPSQGPSVSPPITKLPPLNPAVR
jgi:hypothetical protein